jgi:hypothetical protein
VRLVPFLLLLLLCTACQSTPDVFTPPYPREPLNALGAAHIGQFVQMNDVHVDAYIVRDISPNLQSGAWRWGFKAPELRFRLGKVAGLKLKVEYDIPQSTLMHTGPVTLAIYANTSLVKEEVVSQADRRQVAIPVSASLLFADSVNTISIEPDKTWRSPTDGGEYGVILFAAGFVK